MKHLVTSALPYVNNIPHLGNLIGSTLSADVFARHKRLQGHEVLYVCGADEHGTMTEIKAKEEGLTPQELCDKYGKIHKDIYDWFGISFDVWGRTHSKEQEEITHAIFKKLQKNGYIFEKEVNQWYDQEAKQYLSDRFVEGICPHCGESGARGDQCDSCQKLVTATELKNPVSKLTGSTPIIKSTNHLFIDLPKLKSKLEPWVKQHESKWSKNTVTTTHEWIANIKPRAITRDLSWGVPVPMKGYENKVFYVWFDAPIGYISITAHARKDWKDWWNTDDVTLTQFMGKDNIVFHSVIFPSTLLGTNDQWTLVDKLNTTEFLNMERGKFSKSRKTGIFGDDCIALQDTISADVWRYYLLSTRPETADAVFAWKDFQARTNNELLANLGNLVHRTLHFAYTKCKGVMPIEPDAGRVQDVFQEHLLNAQKHLDKADLKQGLQELMLASKFANTVFQEYEPWKDEPERAAGKIRALASLVKDLSIAIHPYLPRTATTIQDLLGISKQTYKDIGTPLPNNWTERLKQPTVLFTKLEDPLIANLETQFSPMPADLDLRVGKILKVAEHPSADKLYILQVDLGTEKRQLVAGLREHYTQKDLEGTSIIVLANLKPATIRGQESQGMLLASEKGKDVGILRPNATPGTLLSIKGERADEQITYEQFAAHTITSTKQGVLIDGRNLEGAAVTVDKDAYGKVQ